MNLNSIIIDIYKCGIEISNKKNVYSKYNIPLKWKTLYSFFDIYKNVKSKKTIEMKVTSNKYLNFKNILINNNLYYKYKNINFYTFIYDILNNIKNNQEYYILRNLQLNKKNNDLDIQLNILQSIFNKPAYKLFESLLYKKDISNNIDNKVFIDFEIDINNLKFDIENQHSGVYLFYIEDKYDKIYLNVGQTIRNKNSLIKRINEGYGKINPYDLLIDGQYTNVKNNIILTMLIKNGYNIKLEFIPVKNSNEINWLEQHLINVYKPILNEKLNISIIDG